MRQTSDAYSRATTHRVQIDGTSIAYRVFGKGPALVFVHGWPLSGHTFRGLANHLHADFTCYVPDLPGAGQSPPRAGARETFTDFAALLGGFVDAVKLDRFCVAGNDSGGTIARLLAVAMPERVDGMFLFNTETPGRMPWLVRVLQWVTRLPAAAWMIRQLLNVRAYRNSALGFGGCFEDERLLDGQFFEVTVRPLLQDPSAAVSVLRQADLSIVDRLQKMHGEIACPVLCIWGESDRFFPIADARHMVDEWPNATLHALPGRRLLVHEESPQEVARVMREFALKPARSFPRQNSGMMVT